LSQRGLDNRNLLCYGSGGWKSEIKVLAGLVTSEGCDRETAACLFASFW